MKKSDYFILLIFLIIALLFSSFFTYYFLTKQGYRIFASCEDNNQCTKDDYDFKNRTCLHELLINCGGNGICEVGEYGNSSDCLSCDDNSNCTIDSYDYYNKTCLNQKIIPCKGNNLCESGEYSISSDCPDCDDEDKCTSDNYDYSEQICTHRDIYSCCGNKVCEHDEDYLNCNKDCEVPLRLGELTTEEKYRNYYVFDGDFVKVNGTALEANNITGSLGDYGGFKTHVIILKQNIYFNEKIYDVYEFDNVSLQCEDQEGNKIEAKGNYGWSVLMKNNEPYIVIDDSYLKCAGYDNCTGKKIDNMIGIKQGYKNGKAEFDIQFLVNPKYNINLVCKGAITTGKPIYRLSFDFDVYYKKPG